MAEKSFTLEIVTPRKVVFNGSVNSFSAPGVMGSFQVLFNHAPMLAEIGVGEVKIQQPEGAVVRFATSGGFVEVKQNHVILLAETIERSDEIDRSRAEAARGRAQGRISDRAENTDVPRARFALERAQNRLRLSAEK